MSAWSTNGRHNAILADGLAVYGIIEATPTAASAAFHTLADENDRSLHYRYGDSLNDQRDARYAYVPGGEVTPGQLASLAESYDYQSCEHPDYRTSQAAEWIRLLRQAITDRHGISFDTIDFTSPDYAWSISALPERDNDAWYRQADALNRQVTP